MRRSNLKRVFPERCWSFILILLCGLMLLPLVSSRAQKTRARAKCKTAEECLSLGMFYYNNDDTNDKASEQFNQVISRFSRSYKQVEQARYYLASYYQRKYYIQMYRLRKDDRALLNLSARKYREYTDQYYQNGSSQWLADAFFNQALAFLQLGDNKRAYEELSKMRDANSRDGSVYIYEIVWSPKPEDVVDTTFPTRSLADFTLGVLSGQAYQSQQNVPLNSFEQKVSVIKRWCQSQRSRKYAS